MNRGPLLTLGGLVALFVLMFAANLANSQPRTAPYGTPSPTAGPSSAAAPGPEPSPVQSSPAPSVSGLATAKPSAKPTAKSAYPDQVGYAGRTHDGSTAVAVAVLNGRAAAYICDGRRVESWLKGAVKGEDQLAVSGRNSSLTGELHTSGPDRLEGKIIINGRASAFEIGVAEKPAGLYRAKGGKMTIGWIILPDGSQVGIQTDGSGSRSAPPLDPDEPAVAGDEQLDAGPVTGATDI